VLLGKEMIKVDFQITKDGLTFSDSIVLQDNNGMTESQIDEMKQSRYNAWLEAIKPVDEEPQE